MSLAQMLGKQARQGRGRQGARVRRTHCRMRVAQQECEEKLVLLEQ